MLFNMKFILTALLVLQRLKCNVMLITVKLEFICNLMFIDFGRLFLWSYIIYYSTISPWLYFFVRFVFPFLSMPVAATKSCWKQFRVSFSTLELASFWVSFWTLFAVSFTGRHSLKQTSTAAVICNITNVRILIIPIIIIIINIMMMMMNSNSMRKQTIEVCLLWMLLLCVVLYSRVAQMKSKFSLWLTLPCPKLCQV